MSDSAPISSPRLRVLVVPHLTELSGAPLTAGEIAVRLDPLRFDCRVVFPGPGPLADRLRARGCPVDTLELLPLSLAQARAAHRAGRWMQSRLRYARRLDGVLRQSHPDLVYIHSAVQLIPGLVAWKRRIPIVWHVQETLDLSQPGNRLRRRVIRRLARAVIFCGWTPRRAFGRPPRGRLWKVIPNAVVHADDSVPPSARDEVRSELGLPPGQTVLITVGGVHPRKGLDILLEALGLRLGAGLSDFVLLVVGDPSAAPADFRTKLEGLLDGRGLRAHVRFLGHRDDVPRLLAASDVFVLASRNEGLPLAVVEAFGAGLPAVLTDTGDCALLAGHGRRGFTVPCEDPASLADALDRLLQDPDLRRCLGQRAHRLARKRFPFSRLLRDVAGVLETVARP